MNLRCLFGFHPWKFMAIGSVVARTCTSGCGCSPQQWKDERWQAILPIAAQPAAPAAPAAPGPRKAGKKRGKRVQK